MRRDIRIRHVAWFTGFRFERITRLRDDPSGRNRVAGERVGATSERVQQNGPGFDQRTASWRDSDTSLIQCGSRKLAECDIGSFIKCRCDDGYSDVNGKG